MRRCVVLSCVVLLVACSSSGSSGSSPPPDPDAGDDADAATAIASEHGTIIDYQVLLTSGRVSPVEGLTVTDGDQSTTTDVQGNWSLTVPLGATLSPSVAGTSKGDPYSTLFLPTATPAGTDVDRGTVVVADQSTFTLEQQLLSSDSSQAIVHVGALTASSCPSVAGGTINVTSPAGAKVMYFDAQGYPSTSQTSFAALSLPNPVAVLYDVAPGADIELQVSHPTCTASALPFTSGGASFDGQVQSMAAEPGDYVSVVLIQLQ
jgi:hypothetical protein